ARGSGRSRRARRRELSRRVVAAHACRTAHCLPSFRSNAIGAAVPARGAPRRGRRASCVEARRAGPERGRPRRRWDRTRDPRARARRRLRRLLSARAAHGIPRAARRHRVPGCARRARADSENARVVLRGRRRAVRADARALPVPPAARDLARTLTGMPPLARVDVGALRLALRPAVACRETSWASRPAFYLSIYDDEIDERAEAWSAALRRLDASGPTDPVALGSCLEPTDAVITLAADGKIVAARGGCCTFPLYWRRSDPQIEISTSLPIGPRPMLCATGLVKAAAAVNLCSSYEPNAWCETPLAGWRRLRRGVVTALAIDAPVRETPVLHRGSGDIDAAAVTRNVRAALDAYGATQRRVDSSIVELSGGFDSTLAAAAALRP